jgi:hypothetical protein
VHDPGPPGTGNAQSAALPSPRAASLRDGSSLFFFLSVFLHSRPERPLGLIGRGGAPVGSHVGGLWRFVGTSVTSLLVIGVTALFLAGIETAESGWVVAYVVVSSAHRFQDG